MCVLSRAAVRSLLLRVYLTNIILHTQVSIHFTRNIRLFKGTICVISSDPPFLIFFTMLPFKPFSDKRIRFWIKILCQIYKSIYLSKHGYFIHTWSDNASLKGTVVNLKCHSRNERFPQVAFKGPLKRFVPLL